MNKKTLMKQTTGAHQDQAEEEKCWAVAVTEWDDKIYYYIFIYMFFFRKPVTKGLHEKNSQPL